MRFPSRSFRALVRRRTQRNLALVVVIVNAQRGLVETEAGRDVERDLPIPALATGDGLVEACAGSDGPQARAVDVQHVGSEGTHQSLCGETFDMELDDQFIAVGLSGSTLDTQECVAVADAAWAHGDFMRVGSL